MTNLSRIQGRTPRQLGIALLLFLTLGGASLMPHAQTFVNKQKIEAGLLTTPAQCGTPCIWTVRPGVDTLGQFQSFAAQLYTGVDSLNMVADGLEYSGVGLYATVVQDTDPASATVIDYVYVRLVPEEAAAAGFVMSGFEPARIISALGNPTQAYLLAARAQINKSNRFRLFMVYRPQAALYVMTGQFANGKACLTLANALTLTLYRFKDVPALDTALKGFLTPNKGALPPNLAATTDRTLADFAAIATNPQATCLSLR